MALLKVSCSVIIPVLFIMATYLQTGSAILCYECNSHNDSRCADEKLPEMLKKDCSEHMKGVQYTMCRKIVQNIDFEVNGNMPDSRVIRGCGFDESNYKGRCYQRSGFGGRQEVCSCLTDFCNGAPLGRLSPLLGSAAALALFAALY